MARLQLYGLIIVGFVFGLAGIYFAGISRGLDKIKRKMDEKRFDNFRIQMDVDDEIDTLNDTSLAARASEFVRKD